MADVNDISLARTGDDGAFGRLMAEYSPLMVCLCSRFYNDGLHGVGLDDLMQEASIAFYHAICTYSEGKHTTFGLYAKICIKNALVSYMRKHPSFEQSSLELEKAEETPSGELDPLDTVISAEQLSFLKQRIKSLLTEYEHKVFVRYASGRTVKQIASELDVCEKSVYNSIARVKSKLKRLI